MKYIDADRLKAEIDRRMTDNLKADSEIHFTAYFAGAAKEDYDILSIIASLQQEQPEVDLEKFTEKMDAWKARYNYPDNIPIKAAMAFTARMFYMYPNVARKWYDNLPKVSMD